MYFLGFNFEFLLVSKQSNYEVQIDENREELGKEIAEKYLLPKSPNFISILEQSLLTTVEQNLQTYNKELFNECTRWLNWF